MIAVIADDFTGAAEIGGIGLKHGLKVVIETKVEPDEEADLLVIAADTRVLPVDKALVEIEKLTKQLMMLKPKFIYKKIDSALRGNVADELWAQMKVVKKNKSIVIAGNPAINRLIIDGVYYVNNIPLCDTFFSKDKEYKLQSSLVTELVQTKNCNVVSLNIDQEIPQSGLIVGDVREREDMFKWISAVDEDTVLAGGAGFFDVVLEEEYGAQVNNGKINYKLGEKSLIIFGSAFPKDERFMESILQSDVFVSNMPKELYWDEDYDNSIINNWADQVIETLKSDIKVILTINHSGSTDVNISCKIKKIVGQVVQRIVQKVDLNDILIEGGATASVILNYLDITRLYPFYQIEAGVIQMVASGYPNLHITTKPGSYLWPETLLFGEVESKS